MEKLKFVEKGTYENIKTKGIYVVEDIVMNASNANDGEHMVLYKDPITRNAYVREIEEFKIKFKKYEI